MASWHIYPLKKIRCAALSIYHQGFSLMLQLYDVFLHNRRIYTQTHTHTHYQGQTQREKNGWKGLNRETDTDIERSKKTDRQSREKERKKERKEGRDQETERWIKMDRMERDGETEKQRQKYRQTHTQMNKRTSIRKDNQSRPFS